MKKILLIGVLACIAICVKAQQIAEPQFVGEVLLVKSETTAVSLEKKTATVKTKAGASVYLTGIGSVKSRLHVDGVKSSVRCSQADGPIVLIVRAANNENDPNSFIRVFKFEQKKKERRAELAKVNTLGGSSDNNFDFIEYVGEKYGEKSYKLTLSQVEPCEIGVLISNPDKVDEKQMIVRCLGID
ncbi:MAG: hypothetical protein J6B31_00805 [Bacteroidaceae bacterium]|nr:hypothetical protein [Bacteroidaceae bacterium]